VTPLQKIVFVAGVAAAIALGSTVAVLSLERLFPGSPAIGLAGPVLCAGSALIFSRWYFGKL
jgi:hypothetical protein